MNDHDAPMNPNYTPPAFPPIVERVVAHGRAESDPCECGTPGCCIDHGADAGGCETW